MNVQWEGELMMTMGGVEPHPTGIYEVFTHLFTSLCMSSIA